MPFLAALLVLQTEPDFHRKFAAGKSDAFYMAPPEVVSGAYTTRIVWASDGTLVALREIMPPGLPAPGEKRERSQQLFAWSGSGKPSRVLFDPGPNVTIADFAPMGKSDRLLLTGERKVTDASGVITTFEFQTLMSARSGTNTILLERKLNDETPIFAMVSPIQPLGFVFRALPTGSKVTIFGSNGTSIADMSLKPRQSVHLDDQGQVTLFYRDEKKLLVEQVFNLSTRQWGAVRPFAGERAVKNEVPLLTVEQDGYGRRPARFVNLKVRDGKPDDWGIVSTDGTNPELSPKGNAVAYLDQGVAMVRTIHRMDRAAYDQALRDAERAEAVNKAKQIGLAIQMYAADMDDHFPNSSDDVNALLMPYLKDASLFSGFTYTFGGGLASDIDKPAETELGYVSGTGGRAVIYADGHAKWIPDKP